MSREPSRSPPPRELLLQWTMGAAITLWLAYVLYGEVDGQGVTGWLAELSIRWSGSSSTNLNIIIAMAIGMLPISLVFAVLARALGATLVRRRGAPPSGTPQQIRRRAILGGIGIMLAAGVLVYVVRPRREDAPAVPFDLDTAVTAAPPDAPRVAVTGTPRPDLVAGYRETSSTASASTTYRFVPLTGKAWVPEAPVRFFVAEVQRSDETQARGIVAVRAADGRTRFEGKLRRNGLATIARGALEHAGVKLADPYWVIYNDTLETIGLATMIACLGFALGLAVILTGTRAARQAPRRPQRPAPPRSAGARLPPPTPPPMPPPRPGTAARAQHPAPPATTARVRPAMPPPLPPGATRPRSA